MDHDEIQQIQKRLEELYNEKPSKVLTGIERYKKEHKETIARLYGYFILEFDLYFSLLVDILHAVNYIDKKDWPKHRAAQFIMITYNLKSIYSAYDKFIEGFYEDGITLSRTAYEALIRVIYISCYPQNPYVVFVDKKGEQKFSLTNFLRQELRLNWNHYIFLSVYAHANGYSVLKEAKKINERGQDEAITLEFHFEKELLEIGINYILFLLLSYYKIVLGLFITKTNDILTDEILQKAKELESLSNKNFLQHPKDYWKFIVQDLNDVLKMVAFTEDGKDWREEWKNIRGDKFNKISKKPF